MLQNSLAKKRIDTYKMVTPMRRTVDKSAPGKDEPKTTISFCNSCTGNGCLLDNFLKLVSSWQEREFLFDIILSNQIVFQSIEMKKCFEIKIKHFRIIFRRFTFERLCLSHDKCTFSTL